MRRLFGEASIAMLISDAYVSLCFGLNDNPKGQTKGGSSLATPSSVTIFAIVGAGLVCPIGQDFIVVIFYSV
eukprot:m.303104 g.303104  ORF g.303104 m.303104 type:complete len:72 (+) comp330158_c0_seq1:11-226(+)